MKLLNRPRGFTLIETMVVMAVIALSGAIVFAALAPVRERGRQAVCVSNLRQIGQAIAVYHSDYEDSSGNCGGFFGFPPSVTFLYPRYVSTLQLFRCPDDVSGRIFSYGYQVWRGTDPVYIPIAGRVIHSPSWCQVFSYRGDNYPLMADPHHATPEQRATGPRFWLILRTDGRVERVWSGPTVPSWGL